MNLNEAMTLFKPYCDHQSDLILKKGLSEAKDFLQKSITADEEQKHLDFIITDWKFETTNSRELLTWIRNSNATYSSKNFQFCSIPVLLIEDTINQSASIYDGFDGIVANDFLRLESEAKSAIKSWRYALAQDLDLIGLDPKSQQIYPDHRSTFISYYRLKVLTRTFVDSHSKKLNYLWTAHSAAELDISSHLFDQMIGKTLVHPRSFSEKDFHNLFKQHPTLIKGEHYVSNRTKEDLIYEPHLYKFGSRKYDEPDFLNKPRAHALRSPEVFEIKLPTQKILRYEQDSFISKARKSFAQAKRYKDYVTSSDPRHQHYVIKYFGKLHSDYLITLLMGSKDEKAANEDLIERLKRDFEFDDINLVTYEELLENHVKLCNRLRDFDIF